MNSLLNPSLLEDFYAEYGMIYEDIDLLAERAAPYRDLKSYYKAEKKAGRAYNRKQAGKNLLGKAKRGFRRVGQHMSKHGGKYAAGSAAALAGYGAYRYGKSRRARGANESEIIDTMISVLRDGIELCYGSDRPGACKRMIENRIETLYNYY